MQIAVKQSFINKKNLYIILKKGDYMKSLKKLLVGAIASNILCSPVSSVIEAKGRYRSKSVGSGISRDILPDVVGTNGEVRPYSTAQGMSRGSRIALGGVGFTLGIGGILACGYYYYIRSPKSKMNTSKFKPIPIIKASDINDISSEVADRKKNIKHTKEKIVDLMGEKKYGVLHKACERFSKDWWEGCLYVDGGIKAIVPSVISLELMHGSSSSELQDKSEISSLFNSLKEINGFHRENLYGIISTCLRVIGNGICPKQKIIGMEGSDGNWGNGLRFEPISEKEYYLFFVNSELNKIKLCYHNGWGEEKEECTIVLEV